MLSENKTFLPLLRVGKSWISLSYSITETSAKWAAGLKGAEHHLHFPPGHGAVKDTEQRCCFVWAHFLLCQMLRSGKCRAGRCQGCWTSIQMYCTAASGARWVDKWHSVIRFAVLVLELSSLRLMDYWLLRANTLDACLSSLCIYDLSLDLSADKGPVTFGLTVS